jgi:hypothetical protein
VVGSVRSLREVDLRVLRSRESVSQIDERINTEIDGEKPQKREKTRSRGIQRRKMLTCLVMLLEREL